MDQNDNREQGNNGGRGFAGMDPNKQKEISSKGGKAAHQKGTAHEFSSDEAREAGRKCGQAVSRDRAHMAAIGRQGGKSRGAARRRAAETQSANVPQARRSGQSVPSGRPSGSQVPQARTSGNPVPPPRSSASQM